MLEGTKKYKRNYFMKKPKKNQVIRALYFSRIREIIEKESILISQPIDVSFDIRSFYLAFRVSPMRVFPWKCVWRSKAPRRVCFFV